MEFEDKSLTCRECGAGFTFTVGEQEYFKSRGLLNEPGRCSECRAARRRGGASRGERQYFDVVCATCGKDARVPFEPRGDRPVYCDECFASSRDTR